MSEEIQSRSALILSVGTQVVTHIDIKNSSGETLCLRGAVGEIVKAPVDNLHSYRVCFANKVEAVLQRDQLAVLKHFQLTDPERADIDLFRWVIYRCIVGSRAYGLDQDGSDTDRRGIYLPPAERHWSLAGVPEQVENQESQECYWELQKFLTLALKANPNVLECLYTPLVEEATPLARELLETRTMFLSQLVYQTYNGYVLSQFKKLEQDLRNRGAIKWKHAMHLIRLLLSGVTVLKDGFVPVRVEEHRERLLAIRRGEVPWDEVNDWRLSLHKRFDDAYARTHLPERPDYETANAFLLRARRQMASSNEPR